MVENSSKFTKTIAKVRTSIRVTEAFPTGNPPGYPTWLVEVRQVSANGGITYTYEVDAHIESKPEIRTEIRSYSNLGLARKRSTELADVMRNHMTGGNWTREDFD